MNYTTIVLLLAWNVLHLCAAAKYHKHDYKVTNLTQFGLTDDTYAGFIPITLEPDNSSGSFFYWLVKKRGERNNTTPLVIWLNGGPGCSSMVGMMFENGPFTIESIDGNSSYSLVTNPYSWNELVDVLYVEQPLTTGFSIPVEGAQQIRDEAQIAHDFHNWYLSFISIFDEYQNTELYIAGESYAGAYIPWIAEHILKYQLKNPKEFQINLQGVFIGNGVIDMFLQMNSYAVYAYYHGLIPQDAKTRADDMMALCEQKTLGDLKHPHGYLSDCGVFTFVLAAAGQPNQYNTGTFKQYTNIVGNSTVFERFMNDPIVQEAIHVRGYDLPGLNFIPSLRPNDDGGSSGTYYADDGRDNPHDDSSDDDDGDDTFYGPNDDDGNLRDDDYQVMSPTRSLRRKLYSHSDEKKYYYVPSHWSVCHQKITDTLAKYDHPKISVPAIQFAAKHIRVMLYSGELDLNCNTVGTLSVLQTNTWLGKTFDTASRGLWWNDGDVAGEYFKISPDVSALHGYEGGEFSFLIVRNAGHLVPMDKPANALELLRRFTKNISFIDSSLPSEISYSRSSGLGGQAPISFNRPYNTFATNIVIALLGLVCVIVSVTLSQRKKAKNLSSQMLQMNYDIIDDESSSPALFCS
jgi:carboxypeptidase C (cathepsin A)